MREFAVLPPLADALNRASGWEQKTRQLMLSAKSLPVLSEERRCDASRVDGCQSQVYVARQEDHLAGWADSKIVRGVLAIVLEKANLLSKADLTTFDFFQYLTDLRLQQFVSESRVSGIRHVATRLNTLVD